MLVQNLIDFVIQYKKLMNILPESCSLQHSLIHRPAIKQQSLTVGPDE